MDVFIVPWIVKNQVSIVKKVSFWTNFMIFLKIYYDVKVYIASPCVVDGFWAYKLNHKKENINDLLDLNKNYIFAKQLIPSDGKIDPMRYYELTEYVSPFKGRRYVLLEMNKFLESNRFIEAKL